jgi:hypothetical protein
MLHINLAEDKSFVGVSGDFAAGANKKTGRHAGLSLKEAVLHGQNLAAEKL